jgi:hypothetical protein
MYPRVQWLYVNKIMKNKIFCFIWACLAFMLAYINWTKELNCGIYIYAFNVLWSSPLLLFLILSFFTNKQWVYFHICILRTLIIFTSHHPLLSLSLPPTESYLPPKVPILSSCHLFRSRVCVWKKICNNCLSESGLFYLTWESCIGDGL